MPMSSIRGRPSGTLRSVRNTHPFKCPRCGESAGGAPRCLRCDVDLLDANGVPPLAPRPRIIKGWFLGLRRRWLLQPGVKARLHKAGPVTPIKEASGSCHVRGVARLLTPLEHPLLGKVGAYRLQHDNNVTSHHDAVVMVDDSAGPVLFGTYDQHLGVQSVSTFASQIEETSACGRFAVVDETGIAIVDDDAFDVGRVGTPFDSSGVNRFVAVRDGEPVEIIGPARRGHASDAVPLQHDAGYRDTGEVLLFDGTAEDRVLILA